MVSKKNTSNLFGKKVSSSPRKTSYFVPNYWIMLYSIMGIHLPRLYTRSVVKTNVFFQSRHPDLNQKFTVSVGLKHRLPLILQLASAFYNDKFDCSRASCKDQT
jgi:hypothetical protein